MSTVNAEVADGEHNIRLDAGDDGLGAAEAAIRCCVSRVGDPKDSTTSSAAMSMMPLGSCDADLSHEVLVEADQLRVVERGGGSTR